MVIQSSEELYEQFVRDTEAAFSDGEAGTERLAAGIRTVRDYLGKLRELVDTHGFADAGQEIQFFKHTKPKFYQWLIFHVECFSLETDRPPTTGKGVQAHYREQLVVIDRFFRKHAFHYQYYRLGAVEMDHLYFIRGAQIQDILVPEVPEVDPAFGTKMEYLFAKFMAYERLRVHVLELMHKPDNTGDGFPHTTRKGREMKWTGDTCNLIEMAYGIYETKQINEGGADIGDIIGWLEESFGVSLHRYYRRFSEIKQRKTVSKTRFLDEMREAVNRRIDDGNAYKPPKKSLRITL